MSKQDSIIIFLLHMNFLAKWLQLPEFELMNYWYLLIVFLCFYYYYHLQSKSRYLIISGFFMMLQICNYPTMLLLYPVYMLGIYMQKRSVKKEMLITTLSAVIPGIGFMLYLFSYMNVGALIKSVAYVISDPSHMERSLIDRFAEYLAAVAKDILCAGILFFMIFAVIIIWGGRTKKGTQEGVYALKDIKSKVVTALLLEVIIYSMIQMTSCIFCDQNQFYLQSRYLVILSLGLVLCCGVYKSMEQMFFWFGFVPGVTAMFAALLITNMTMNVAYSKLFIGVLVTFMVLLKNKSENSIKTYLSYIATAFVLCSLIVCKLLLIRVTGCLPVTINANFSKIESGALKGIYMVEPAATTINENTRIIKEYVTEKDCFLYVGCENMIYLCTEADISAASVQGTSVFNEIFVEYFEEHQEKYPTVIAVDKNFSTDYYMVYNPYNYIMMDWIEQEYEYSYKMETNHMILYFQ